MRAMRERDHVRRHLDAARLAAPAADLVSMLVDQMLLEREVPAVIGRAGHARVSMYALTNSAETCGTIALP